MEIERKFLIANSNWKNAIEKSYEITQFYLTGPDHSPTVRLRTKGATAFLTLKYPSTGHTVLVREEFEYEIPIEDLQAQAAKAKGSVIRKTRHLVRDEFKQIWEIDEFSSPNPQLVLAEIELQSADQTVQFPTWLGAEVTTDDRYSNINMAFT